MIVKLVKTGDRRWLKEGASASWGLGVEVTSVDADRDTGTEIVYDRVGWWVVIRAWSWSIDFWTGEAWPEFHGPGWHPQPKFEVIRP